MTSVLRFERCDAVAVLTLDRPESLNSIGSDTVALIHAALDVVERDSDLRAIVVTGSGRAFSAGADITELDRLADGTDFAAFVEQLTDAYDRVAACPAPSIAAINGLALGGGFELALACDLRIVAPGARLGVPEVRLGLLPAAAGTQRLARMVPAAIAKHMLMTGEPIAAGQALTLGLVNAVEEDPMAAAFDLATRLASGPPAALAAAKRLVDEGGELTLADGIDLERTVVSALFDTADRMEGVSAFLAKRPPQFNGG